MKTSNTLNPVPPPRDNEAATPSSLTLRMGRDSTLLVRKDGATRFTAVTVNRCFPWSNPSRYISLRDKDGDEYALIDDADQLDPASRQALYTILATVSFTMTIEQILEIKPDYELRNWKVQAREGLRTFQTELDEWPIELSDGAMLIKDIAGDLYRITDVQKLDSQSKGHFWAFMD